MPGQTPTIGALGSISATPGIHVNQKINLMNQDGVSSAALAAHQRNFYSQIQRSSNSTKSRFDAYKATNAEGASGRAPPNGQHEGAGIATTLSSAAALQLQERESTNRDVVFRVNNQNTFDALEMTQLRQIQIAESAVNEMRVALNQHKADSTVVMVTGEGSTDKQQQSQPRPRSQNDDDVHRK